MKKGVFAGWRDVFSFTFHENSNGKYKRTTIIVAIILLILGAAIPVIMAFSQKDNDDGHWISPVATVHIVNESSLSQLVTEQFEAMNREWFPDLTFSIENGTAAEVASKITDSRFDLLLHITDTEEGFLLKSVIPSGSELSKDDADKFLSSFISVAEVSKMVSSGIAPEKLAFVMSGTIVESIEAGVEEKSEGEEAAAMIIPMLVSFLLYFIILVYGVQMGQAVSVEKTSKLMEMILTMTRPYGLVLGKILAMVTGALVQLFTWVGSILVGFVAGDYVAGAYIYDGFDNVVLDVLEILQSEGAFTVSTYILSIAAVIVSVLFFSLLAATFGSFASKTEEVGQYMAYFQMFAILGFIASYFLPLNDNQALMSICRFVPFTSAYMLPADILVGNVSVLYGSLLLLLLAAFTAGLVFLVGKVYKNQLFFRGESAVKSIFRKKRSGVHNEETQQ